MLLLQTAKDCAELYMWLLSTFILYGTLCNDLLAFWSGKKAKHAIAFVYSFFHFNSGKLG